MSFAKTLFAVINGLVQLSYGHRWRRTTGGKWICRLCHRIRLAPEKAIFDPCWERLP